MDGTLPKPEVGTLDTAILLASSGVFDIGVTAEPDSVGALTRIGGLTLFQRTVFTLQRGGISQIFALVGDEEAELRALIHADDRVRAVIRWLPTREFPPSDPQTWETLASEVKSSCLILGCHMVFSPGLVESIREESRDGRVVVAVGRPGDPGWTGNPGVLMRASVSTNGVSHRVVFHDKLGRPNASSQESGEGLAPAVDLVVLPSRLLGISGAWNSPEPGPIRLALEQAAAEGVVHTVSASPHGYVDARGTDGPTRAERMLFRSFQTVKGGLDGVIDRYVNRKFSAVFTRGFIRLGLSPNSITVLSMIVGLIGAACFAAGSYGMGIVGALLFQLSVIIDCCDGEVARLTFAESPFGQELDIIADNIVHMAIFAGVAWGSYLTGPWAQTHWPLLLGAIAILGNGFSLWCVNVVRHMKANPLRWSRLNLGQRKRLEFILGNVANRDFSVVVLLSACMGILPWFLWLGAVGSSFFALFMAWILRRALLPRST